MRSCFNFLVTFVLAALLTQVSFAQQKPKENAQVLVGVKMATVSANGMVYARLYGGGETDRFNLAFNGPGFGYQYLPDQYALMTPGKHYQMVFSSAAWDKGEVKFSAPAGYSVYLDDQPVATRSTETYYQGSGTHLIFKIVVRANDESSFLPAGMAAPPQVGDIVWSISMGRYSNGLSAGALQWRTSNFSSALLDPTSLIYTEPDSPEIYVTRHSDGGILEVDTFQCVMYIRRNPTPGTGYTVEVYHPWVSRSGSGDGPYTYSDNPFRKFIVSNPAGSWNDEIKIEKIEVDAGNRSETWNLKRTFTASGVQWTVTQTNSLRLIKLVSTSIGGGRQETVTVSDAAGQNIATEVQRTFQNFPWGQEELTQEISGPNSVTPLTTSYQYYTAGGGGYGRLKSVTRPNGSWERYVYDDSAYGFGDLTAVYKPWQDAPTTPDSATASNCQATTFTYTGWRDLFSDQLLSSVEQKINGITVGKSTSSYSRPGNAPNGQPLETVTTQTYSSGSAYLTSTATNYAPTASADFRRRLYAQTGPDGTKTSTVRYKGYWWNYGDSDASTLHKWPGNPGADNTWGEYRFNGFSTQVQDSVPVSSWDGQSFDTVYMVPNRSTVDLDVYNSEGQVWAKVAYVFTGAPGGAATFSFLKMTELSYDKGILAIKHATNGEHDQLWFIGNTLSGHSYNDGSYVEYTRDALDRDYLVRKWYIDAGSGYPAQGTIYTHKTFDIAGRVLTEKVSSSSDPAANPADAVTTARTFSKAGLLLTETAELGAGNFTTSFVYANGGRTVTTTLPGGSTKITDTYLDGSAKSVTGTSVVPTFYTTTVNADGTITSQTNVGSSASPRWAKTTTDWLGRHVKSESPGYSGGTVVKQSFYNAIGQLVKTSETGLGDTLYSYNAWQQLYRAGLDVNGSGALEPVSTDRIADMDSSFNKDGNGAWWATTTTKVYTTNNSGSPVTASVSKNRLNKFDDHGRFFGSYVQSESIVSDIFGNETKTTVAVQRGSSYFETNLKLVTATTHYPDSISDEVVVSRNGLVQSTKNKQGLTSYSYYDARGRLVKQTDPRIDPSASPRTGFVANSDRVAWTEDSAGNRTNIGYYGDTGRVYSVTNALGKATYTAYDALGHVIHSWGPATYPVEYTFNSYGEQTGMKTFRSGTTEWTQGTWPASPPAGDSTAWNYEPATGLLLSKTDAQGRAVAYTYNARGQLSTRTWARGVTTTYGYDPKTAEQTSITYSDGTPNVTYVYDRRGLNASITDAIGTRTFDHSDSGKVTAEYLPSFYQNRELRWTLDTSTPGAKGRTTGLYSGTSGNGMNEYGVGFGYDAYGRVSSVLGMNYTYTPNSNLIATVADPGSAWAQYRNYESNRNLLSSIQTKFSTATRASFAYGHDALGRRTSLTQTGDMFSMYPSGGLSTTWGYNDRSEVTSSQTNYVNTSTAVLGRSFGYNYDPIGNRTSSSLDSATTTYTPNSLNQYTQRTNPGQVVATGLAPANANVTVNGQATTRQGEYYHKALGVSNAANPAWASLNILSDLGGSYNRYSFVPQATEAFGYDNDGNITSDSRWVYTWDAENRLISLETAAIAYNAGVPRQRIEFKYDYLGRRVQKQVSTWTTPGWNLTSQSRFLYDGWNVIREFDTTSGYNAKWTFVWGIDLSGNLQDAGGVGGLLWAYDGGTQLMPVYDGNGNVYGLTERFSGSLRAIYEYSPYGETLRSSGDLADKNPFRFSTKYTDAETQMLYYGFRYYSPSLGRFYGRDPIEEAGGLHLYAFCGNNGINGWDVLGMMFDKNATLDDYIAVYKDVDIARFMKMQDEFWNWDRPHFYGSAGDAASGINSDGGLNDSWMGGFWNDDGSFAGWNNPNSTGSHNRVDQHFGYQGSTASALTETIEDAFAGNLQITGSAGTGGITISDKDKVLLTLATDNETGQLATYDESNKTWNPVTSTPSSVVAPNNAGIGFGPNDSAAAAAYLRVFAPGQVATAASAQAADGKTLFGWLDQTLFGVSDTQKQFYAAQANAQNVQTANRVVLASIDPAAARDLMTMQMLTQVMQFETGVYSGALVSLPGQCFPAGTIVSTPKGDVKIEDIKAGDVVYAYDFESGSVVQSHVQELLHNFTFNWMKVTVAGETIRATRGHRFWVESEKRWVEAVDLKVGMTLRMNDGTVAAITAVELTPLSKSETTYNLEVEKQHTYFVGRHHVLVHNGPDFIVTPSGQVFPVPAGATGPAPMSVPGLAFTGGSGGNGLNPRVTDIIFRDANWNQGPRVSYYNTSGQKVNPFTGQTISNSDPLAHIPCW